MTVLSPETLSRILGVAIEELDCAGLRLHLGEVFEFRGGGYLGRERRSLGEVLRIEPADGVYRLGPGAYRIRYREVVRVPPNCIALAIPRSSLLRMGAVLYTAVWDPGYEGRGEGLLQVLNPFGVELEEGVQVAQLVFVSMDRETSRLYRGAFYRENI